MRHTLAHELVHASGVLNHSKELHDAVDDIAPGVSISDSPMLQEKREEYLDSVKVKSWSCKHCGYEWNAQRFANRFAVTNVQDHCNTDRGDSRTVGLPV